MSLSLSLNRPWGSAKSIRTLGEQASTTGARLHHAVCMRGGKPHRHLMPAACPSRCTEPSIVLQQQLHTTGPSCHVHWCTQLPDLPGCAPCSRAVRVLSVPGALRELLSPLALLSIALLCVSLGIALHSNNTPTAPSSHILCPQLLLLVNTATHLFAKAAGCQAVQTVPIWQLLHLRQAQGRQETTANNRSSSKHTSSNLLSNKPRSSFKCAPLNPHAVHPRTPWPGCASERPKGPAHTASPTGDGTRLTAGHLLPPQLGIEHMLLLLPEALS